MHGVEGQRVFRGETDSGTLKVSRLWAVYPADLTHVKEFRKF